MKNKKLILGALALVGGYIIYTKFLKKEDEEVVVDTQSDFGGVKVRPKKGCNCSR